MKTHHGLLHARKDLANTLQCHCPPGPRLLVWFLAVQSLFLIVFHYKWFAVGIILIFFLSEGSEVMFHYRYVQRPIVLLTGTSAGQMSAGEGPGLFKRSPFIRRGWSLSCIFTWYGHLNPYLLWSTVSLHSCQVSLWWVHSKGLCCNCQWSLSTNKIQTTNTWIYICIICICFFSCSSSIRKF